MSLGCNYHAPTFGARYPDGCCIDGFMWDLDSGSGDGMLDSGGDIPCPACNTAEFVEWRAIPLTGNAHQRRTARRAHIKRVRVWAEARSSFPTGATP